MSEFLERLSRFTPDGSALNRDALLFAAGRASARRSRAWKMLAAALASTQLLTLALLWPRPDRHESQAISPVESAPPAEMPAGEATNFFKLQEQALASEGKLRLPVTVDNLAPADPPLHALTAAPNDLLN